MELFDVLDKDRKPLGYTKIRGEELLPEEYNMGCEIWIINDNKLLLTQRSVDKSHPLEWEVPGGCSQVGEMTIDTIIREVHEEIGIDINKEDVILIGTNLYKKQFVDVYKTNKNIDINMISIQKEEINDCKFVTKEEFIQMAENNKIVKSVYDRYHVFKIDF